MWDFPYFEFGYPLTDFSTDYKRLMTGNSLYVNFFQVACIRIIYANFVFGVCLVCLITTKLYSLDTAFFLQHADGLIYQFSLRVFTDITYVKSHHFFRFSFIFYKATHSSDFWCAYLAYVIPKRNHTIVFYSFRRYICIHYWDSYKGH